MTRWMMAVLGLVLANVVLGSFGRSMSREHEMLRARLDGLAQDANEARIMSEERRELEELVVEARRSAPPGPLDIGPLREILFGAEQGLPIERLSLDFRPEQRVPNGFSGSKIHQNLTGSLEALFGYLDRIEAMHLPLAPETLTLRKAGSSLDLAIRWSARWPIPASDTPPQLSAEEVSLLASWLSREGVPNLGRDLFSGSAARSAVETPAELTAEPVEPEPEPEEPAAAPEARPELTGFVLARPELESDVSRRVLAAMRFEGGMELVQVGDAIGDYVVESIAARESVTLTHSLTGERIVLVLE